MFGILKDLKGWTTKRNVCSVPITNNTDTRSRIYLDIFYENGACYTYEIIDSSTSVEELVKIYEQKIMSDSPIVNFFSSNLHVFIRKNTVAQFLIRGGD